MTDFKTKLIQTRTRLGLTQEELSAELGVSSQYVSKLERGVSVPSARLERALDMVLDRRMERHETMRAEEPGARYRVEESRKKAALDVWLSGLTLEDLLDEAARELADHSQAAEKRVQRAGIFISAAEKRIREGCVTLKIPDKDQTKPE